MVANHTAPWYRQKMESYMALQTGGCPHHLVILFFLLILPPLHIRRLKSWLLNVMAALCRQAMESCMVCNASAEVVFFLLILPLQRWRSFLLVLPLPQTLKAALYRQVMENCMAW